MKFYYVKYLLLTIIVITLGISYFKVQNTEEKKLLKDKFRQLDSLNFLNKAAEMRRILDTVKTTVKNSDVVNLSYYYYYMGLSADHDIQINLYADSALSLFKHAKTQKKYPYAYVKILLIKANAFRNLKRYNEALDYYLKIKSIVDGIQNKPADIRNKVEYAQYMQNIADIYYYQHHFPEAAEYYWKAFCIYNTTQDHKVPHVFYFKQGSLNNAGYSYEKANRLDDAERIYRRGLTLISEEKKRGVAKINQLCQSKITFLDNLGGVLAKKGQVEEACKVLDSALLIDAYKQESSKATVYEKLANIYTKKKLFDKAEIALKNADSLILKYPIQNNFLKPRLEKAKSNFFSAQKKYLHSNKHLIRYAELIDSIDNVADELARIDVDSKYQIIRVKQDIESLEEINEHKTTYLIVTCIFIIMIIPIILLIDKNARQSKKAEKEAAKHAEQLKAAMKKLEEKNKDYVKMMKVMAHDLKNPISGMVVIASLLLLEDNFNDEEREMLELIVTSGENSVEMIDQLLKSGLAVENEAVTKEKIDLRQLLRQCTELLSYKANDKNQRVSFISHGNAEIMASREKLWRVFNNLIVNSIKFSPEGTVIKVILEKLGSAVRIAVVDQGIGIAEKDREKIFEMFTEAKRPGTAGEQPFGIGLSISKQIIESHNGKIWLKDNPSGGTIFYVELPI